MAAFAADLFERTDGIVPNGAGHFSVLWAEAAQIAPAADNAG